MAHPHDAQRQQQTQQHHDSQTSPQQAPALGQNPRRDGAAQALDQEQDAVQQMGDNATLNINEGGRTNDSHEPNNPQGAVHGLPKPALKGTWR